ncbi:protein C1orf194 homolog [Sceloporus undulatus]|uniref:protein C1orf194 homolog n=1 Tax=Sceloporus undulatus TaxID=8520 RepID=UPI001C4B1B85|nr:protein C1orf194 homolog [Sceloporus undulatus]
MPTTSCPFPIPDSEDGKPYPGNSQTFPKTPYPVPAHLGHQQDPWNRLHGARTLASIRREVWYSEPEVSRDSLDFHLSALYNHHEDLLQDKNKVVLHKETIFDNHGILKGLEPEQERRAPSVHCPSSKGICVRHWINPVKESIHSIEGAIESPHTAATNSGYSRKENGGIFYH